MSIARTFQTPLLPEVEETESASPRRNSASNKLEVVDRPVHDWYRFVLSFPPHLVRTYLERFAVGPGQLVLDPFAGTGTTLVECKKLGVSSVGVEANAVAHFASETKTDWSPDPRALLAHAEEVAAVAAARLEAEGWPRSLVPRLEPSAAARLRGLSLEQEELLLAASISPLPLHRTLALLDVLKERRDERYHRHELLALAKALVTTVGNLHFGPEVGVGSAKTDAPVVDDWLANVRAVARDLNTVGSLPPVDSVIHYADSRHPLRVLKPNSVDAVFTSPPYPNEKDYTRTTRLESVLLGFLADKGELRALKQDLVRSNTRNVYKDDDDDRWVADNAEVQRIAVAIESRRVELNKDSGFEKLYGRVTRLYFGGIRKHLADLRTILKPGAQLGYVVGDQASYLRVMIRTGQIVAEIAQGLGYDLVGIDLFRTRAATATKEQLREEVVILRWPAPENPRRTPMARTGNAGRYSRLIETIFFKHYTEGASKVTFERIEFEEEAAKLNLVLPKNQGDIVYSFRYRTPLPESILALCGPDEEWTIHGIGRGRYEFRKGPMTDIVPQANLLPAKIPNMTPSIVDRYALNDEQAVLTKIRYNRLIDLSTGVAAHSLQNHLRTTLSSGSQIEIDELYVGVDKMGVQYIIPVQAKSGKDRIGRAQLDQDIAYCAEAYPDLVCVPMAAQLLDDGVIALFQLTISEDRVRIVQERHYKLVAASEISSEDLMLFKRASGSSDATG